MKKLSLPKASRLTSPNPITIICTQKPDGSSNLATVSWWTYLSFNPGMVAFAMAKTSYSGEIVRNTKKVVLATPGVEMTQAVIGCGSTTGRNTDKVAQFGIPMQSLPECDIPIPLHSRVAIVCHLREVVETGDHYLYICEVEQVYGNESVEAVFAWNGYSQICSAQQGAQ